MSDFTISVVIPTMNRPALLRETLQSVANQTLLPKDVIIGDNSDKPELSIEKEFPSLNIIYVYEPKRMGVEKAFTWVISLSDSDYIAFLEDDNLYRPDHLEVISQAISSDPSCGLYSTAAKSFSELPSPVQTDVFAPLTKMDILNYAPSFCSGSRYLAMSLFGTPIQASAVTVNRRVLNETKPALSGCRGPHDRWRWAQLAAQYGLLFIPKETVLFREHELMISYDIKRSQYIEENQKISSLILGLMQSKRIDIKQSISEYTNSISSIRKSYLAQLCLSHRNWNLTTLALPIITGEHLFPALVKTACRSILRKLLSLFTKRSLR